MIICIHILVAALVFAQAHGQASVRRFRLTDSPDNNLEMAPGWQESSLATCAITCITAADPCHIFVYDEETSSCISGVYLLSEWAPVVPGRVWVYTSVACAQPNYTLHMRHDTVMCLRVFSNSLNYTNAALACREDGSHLVTLKTPGKLQLFADVMKPKDGNFWVGLDDLETEGVFKWIDDGTVVPQNLSRVIFAKGQPDNQKNGEDCAIFNKALYPLNDRDCSFVSLYVCEAQPISLALLDTT